MDLGDSREDFCDNFFCDNFWVILGGILDELLILQIYTKVHYLIDFPLWFPRFLSYLKEEAMQIFIRIFSTLFFFFCYKKIHNRIVDFAS